MKKEKTTAANVNKGTWLTWTHKVRPVRIAEMRVPEAGLSQRRYNAKQTAEIAAKFDPNLFGIPAVNHRDDGYWVVDGQHRIAAAKIWFAPSDPGSVDCSVYVKLTDAEMAELFIGLNDRRAVNAYDLFLTSCTAGRTREADIRRVVEDNHCRISQDYSKENSISAVAALCDVYDRAGEEVLAKVIRTLRDAFAGDRGGFDGQLLRGVGSIYNRFNGQTDEDLMVAALSRYRGVAALLRKAVALHEKTGNQKAQCVAAVIVDAYNKSQNGRSRKRLPPWWKSQDLVHQEE